MFREVHLQDIKDAHVLDNPHYWNERTADEAPPRQNAPDLPGLAVDLLPYVPVMVFRILQGPVIIGGAFVDLHLAIDRFLYYLFPRRNGGNYHHYL